MDRGQRWEWSIMMFMFKWLEIDEEQGSHPTKLSPCETPIVNRETVVEAHIIIFKA